METATGAEKLMTVLKDGARSIAEDTEMGPEDDWVPLCIFITKNGEHGICPIPPFGNDQEKYLVFDTVGEILKKLEAVAAAVLTTSWAALLDPTDPGTATFMNSEMRVSEHPARREMVTIYAVDQLAPGAHTAFAEITRHEDEPPTLGEWKESYQEKPEGRLIEPIIEAIQATKSEEVMH